MVHSGYFGTLQAVETNLGHVFLMTSNFASMTPRQKVDFKSWLGGKMTEVCNKYLGLFSQKMVF